MSNPHIVRDHIHGRTMYVHKTSDGFIVNFGDDVSGVIGGEVVVSNGDMDDLADFVRDR